MSGFFRDRDDERTQVWPLGFVSTPRLSCLGGEMMNRISTTALDHELVSAASGQQADLLRVGRECLYSGEPVNPATSNSSLNRGPC